MTRSEIENKIAELYVGILGRAPDYPGLVYWADQIEQGVLSLENTRASFATPNQAEYWNIYGGLSNAELVDKIYANYLERAPDAEGREYWIGELDSGRVAADQMINAIINAVQDPNATATQTQIDAQVLENKVEAALYFTRQMESVEAITAEYITQAQTAVSDVNEDSATIEASKASTIEYKVISSIATDTAEESLLPHLYLQNLRNSTNNSFVTAHSYGDFNGDGHTDIVMAPGIYLSTTPIPLEIYLNDGNDNFALDNSILMAPSVGGLHPRKVVVADFNSDGKDDFIVADHGYDAAPFPGAANLLLLSTDDGLIKAEGIEEIVGFHHSVAVGDIDRDGDIDAFITNNLSKTYFLINDGQGGMSYDADLTPSDTHFKGYFTSELVDVDKDGYLDLLVGGHEYQGAETAIYWGSSSPGFNNELKTVIATAPPGHQIVVDLDVADLNGDSVNDLIINRVGNPPEYDFYGHGGAYIQILEGNGRNFVDVSMRSFDNASFSDNSFNWIEWIRIGDVNDDGSLDIFVDDSWNHSDSLIFLNNGDGVFF